MDTDNPVELVPGVWQIRQQLNDEVPLYLHLVVGTEGSALVDGGLPFSLPAVERLMAAAGVPDQDLRFLLNTHAHHDHIGTFAALRERTGARVVADPAAVRWIEDLEVNLREFALHRPDIVSDSPELRAELAPTFGKPCPVDVTMTDGGAVRLGGGLVLEAIQLPGHVVGELGWLERSSRTLLLGDIVTGTSWSFFHGHVLPGQFRQSLHRLRTLTLDEDVQLVCLAHYASRTSHEFLDLLAEVERYLDQVTETIEGALDDMPRSLTEVWRQTCAEVGRIQEFRGLAMVAAHLREAVAAGRARCVGPDLYVAVRSGG
ncbi:MAG: hydroxyacylglutathione hydrolase [Pseudonocardiales bacterium]|jgi:glyoxylase-like metal-dependent hydrolase (beta-lactamase superfamily II)|nr:hydroxyacylglutathione hydrolase [Pseudonocardiales bacterium]